MYVVTNRNLQPNEPPENRFGKKFNEVDPSELRLAEVDKVDGSWQLKILSDRETYEGQEIFASEAAFLKTQKRMCQNSTNCLVFCHGYNTDFKGALEAAWTIQEIYQDLEVVLFSWPSDGEQTSYRSDKREASQSVYAIDRFFEKLDDYLKKYRDRHCGQKISFAMHSMGAYLLEHLLKSSIYEGETLFFDNIIMMSADVNNQDHVDWVDRIKCRNRLFITINEDDFALSFSELKGGDEQEARLGNTARNLNSNNATYLNFTDAKFVGDAHNYFSKDEPLRNVKVKEIFQTAFNGGRAEQGLSFDVGTGAYKVT
jgi:esterase/lipase superfamily enzyme